MSNTTIRKIIGDSQGHYDSFTLDEGDVWQNFTGNSGGGAIYVYSGAELNRDTKNTGLITFQNNKITMDGGGAIYSQGTVDLFNVLFDGNTASTGNDGGAIYSGGTLSLDGCTFTNGLGPNHAGAISVTSSRANNEVKNCIFIANTTPNGYDYSGGALFVNDASLTVEDCYFKDNKSGSNNKSGAIGLMNSATVTFRGSNVFESETDTINANSNSTSTVIFDLSTKKEGEADNAVVNDYTRFTNTKDLNMTISFSANQESGDYVIAGNASSVTGKSFTVKCDSDSAGSKTVGSEQFEVGGYTCLLKLDSANNLVLSVENLVFVNNAWTVGDEQSTQYHEHNYSGTVIESGTTSRFYNNFAGAVEAAATTGKKIIGIDDDSQAKALVLKGAHTEIDKGNFSKLVIGGNNGAAAVGKRDTTKLEIINGTFSNNVIGSDYVQDDAVTEEKDSRIVVSGGTFNKAIAAGMYAHGTGLATLSKADVTLKIDGGTFNARIYGGNYAKTDKTGTAANSVVNGNISITIDCSHDIVIGGDEGGITAGSRGKGTVKGSTTVTFTGNGTTYLKFDGGTSTELKVWGGCSLDERRIKGDGTQSTTKYVTGSRSLVFDAFQDTNFNAKIGLFTDLQAINESAVNFTNEDLNTFDVTNWLITEGSTITGLKYNDFKDDNLDFYGSAGRTLMTGTSESFLNLMDAKSVMLNGKNAEKGTDCWVSSEAGLRLYVDDNSLKLGTIIA